MLKTYFRITFRSLWRNKWLSFINITGLAIGIAVCLIIMLFVYHELSYDRYNKDADRIYRVYFQGEFKGQHMKESSVMAPVAKVLLHDYPEVAAATRIKDEGTPKLVYQDKSFREDHLGYVDSNFFDLFTLPLIAGNKKTMLQEPNSVVITKAVATKYFGKEDPIGKFIAFEERNKAPLKITGLLEKVPDNTHFDYDMFASMAGIEDARIDNWMSSNYHTYIKLNKSNRADLLEAKLPQLVDNYIGPQMKDGLAMTLEEFRKKGYSLSFHLQPVTDIHLYSDFDGDYNTGDANTVYIFGAIAIFMLLIACINFMNLSTAGASTRSREVGIRKVMGSIRSQLIKQFLVESIVVTAISFLLAIGIIYLCLPLFNNIAEKELAFNFGEHPFFIPVLIAVLLLTGLIAGSYPAFYLSSFKPVLVLKGKFSSGKNSITLRQILVVFQFFISVFLIVGTAVVYKQLTYMQHKDLGYNKEQVVILSNTWMLGKNQEAFRRQVENDARVASITGSRFIPAGNSDNNNYFISPENGSSELVKTLRFEVDENYIPTLGMHLSAGRNFDMRYGTDSNAVIMNETAVKAMDWKDDPIGHYIARTNNKGEKEMYHVIGVVKDFHYRPFHEKIAPLEMAYMPDYGNLIVRLKTTDVGAFTKSMEKLWAQLGASDPLTYSFLDERFYNSYKTERKMGEIVGIFAALTIFVACMGLFGLAKFTAQQRIKEIGIRKVLGASVSQLSSMLSKEFLKLVIIACLIAFPLSWWATHAWLQDFAYRTPIGWMVFAIAALAAILIALITVSFQAIKAAIANPVKSLRSE